MNQKLQITNYLFQVLLAFVLMILAGTFFARITHAQGPTTDDEVNRIGKNLFCPVCPNTPLDQCNTEACSRWRAQIKEMLQSGKSEDQIREYFVAQYGERVLGAPPAQGFNWLAYILPAIAIIAGATMAWFAVQNRMVARTTKPSEAMPIPPQYAERIERELKEN